MFNMHLRNNLCYFTYFIISLLYGFIYICLVMPDDNGIKLDLTRLEIGLSKKSIGLWKGSKPCGTTKIYLLITRTVRPTAAARRMCSWSRWNQELCCWSVILWFNWFMLARSTDCILAPAKPLAFYLWSGSRLTKCELHLQKIPQALYKSTSCLSIHSHLLLPLVCLGEWLEDNPALKTLFQSSLLGSFCQ